MINASCDSPPCTMVAAISREVHRAMRMRLTSRQGSPNSFAQHYRLRCCVPPTRRVA